MYLNVLTSSAQTECDINDVYSNTILSIGDAVLSNANYGSQYKIDRFSFIKAKTLLRFDNNLSLKNQLFKPKVIKKLIPDLAPLEEQDIINNITQEINNFFPDSGELIEDQW